MVKVLEAVYDGTVLRLEEPLALEPNTRVRITVETAPAVEQRGSFLSTARSLKLDGPADWSAHIDEYLYGGEMQGDE